MQKITYHDRAGNLLKGWRIHVRSTAITGAGNVVSENTFSQIAAADQWTIVSAQAADTTQTVTTWYIDANDHLFKEVQSLNGTTRVESTATAKYIVGGYTDSPATGAILWERSNTPTFTDIGSITIGSLSLNVAQWYTGPAPWGIVKFGAGVSSTDGSVDFQLRIHNDDSTTTTGYNVADTIHLTNVLGSQAFHRYDDGIVVVPAGGKVEVFADASGDNSDGWVTFDIVQM